MKIMFDIFYMNLDRITVGYITSSMFWCIIAVTRFNLIKEQIDNNIIFYTLYLYLNILL